MHSSVKRILSLLLMVLFVAGCGASGTGPSSDAGTGTGNAPAQPQPVGDPVRGGVFTAPVISNPAMWPLTGSLPNILPNKTLYNGLTKYEDPSLKPVGDLAESWEVAQDGLSWTFKLRQNVKWHDGEPFNADDVVFTINNIWMNPKISFYLRSNFATLEKAEKVDDFTVKLITKEPTGNLPVMLGYLAAMLPEHILGSWTPEQYAKPEAFTKNPIGTGPFKFKEFVPGSQLRLEANPEYFAGKPYLDGIVFKVMPDVEQQLAQLQSGQLDWMPIEAYQLETVKKQQQNLKVVEAKQVNHIYISFNHLMEPFNDKKVRQALSYATDVDSIIENTLGGKGIRANGPISPFLEQYYNKDAKFYEYDPKKAEQLLEEAGWKVGAGGIRTKDGKPLNITFEVDAGNPTREQTAVIVQELWKKVGVEVTIKTSDYNALLARLRAGPGKADVQTNVNWYVTPPDPDVMAYYGTGKSTNTFFYSNPQVDELLTKGRQATDPAKRVDFYKQAQALIADDAAAIFLYYPYELQALNNKVQGWASIGYRDAFTYTEKVWKSN